MPTHNKLYVVLICVVMVMATIIAFEPLRHNEFTSYDDNTDVVGLRDSLEELKQSLLVIDIELDVKINDKMHDREVRIDNGWVLKIGRGLDFYQRPESWFGVGANDLSLRPCLETKVDIYKNNQ